MTLGQGFKNSPGTAPFAARSSGEYALGGAVEPAALAALGTVLRRVGRADGAAHVALVQGGRVISAAARHVASEGTPAGRVLAFGFADKAHVLVAAVKFVAAP